MTDSPRDEVTQPESSGVSGSASDATLRTDEAYAHLRFLEAEAAALQFIDAPKKKERFRALRDQLVVAALYEIPQVLDALDSLAAEGRSPDSDLEVRVAGLSADVSRLTAALAEYEKAVQQALKVAPNHWQRYRDPFEISPAIRDARTVGRDVLASLRDAGDAKPDG